MNSPDYVWEKMQIAVSCLCGDGSFIERLETATVPALISLTPADLKGDLGEDLKFILKWTAQNMKAGKIQKEPDELERGELIEKMLYILHETSK